MVLKLGNKPKDVRAVAAATINVMKQVNISSLCPVYYQYMNFVTPRCTFLWVSVPYFVFAK
jgi:hypothetical protein